MKENKQAKQQECEIIGRVGQTVSLQYVHPHTGQSAEELHVHPPKIVTDDMKPINTTPSHQSCPVSILP